MADKNKTIIKAKLRINSVVESKLLSDINKEAFKEKRSLSDMIRILLGEAIIFRRTASDKVKIYNQEGVIMWESPKKQSSNKK